MRRLICTVVCLLPLNLLATIRVQLTPSVTSPQPVGTTVTWTAAATDINAGLLTYRYTEMAGGSSQILKDYSQASTLALTVGTWQGNYQVQVTVRNNSTQETAQLTVPFQFTSRVSGNSPVASASSNPLVALFSAPSCPSGSFMRVRFQTAGSSISETNWRPCKPPLSMNFYIAGMRATTQYFMSSQTATGAVLTNGPTIPFLTGAAGVSNFPTVTLPVPANSQTSAVDQVLLIDGLAPTGFPMATDLKGNVIWYYGPFDDSSAGGTVLTRVIPGGTMLLIANGPNSSTATTQQQILREIDLAGNTLRETNATRIQEQLVALGRQSSCVAGSSICTFGAFHHEAIRLPNGHTMAFGDVEQIFPTGTQGSTAPIDIIGDIIVELDTNFQVVWSWSAFDHLDVNRAAVLGETCAPGAAGCPPVFLASIANDWLHTNSLQYRTTDHNLILSMRHQDWVVKIDYRDGAGSGNILWHLGNGGDFSIVSSDPWPWFSHQHDAGFETNGVMTIFDDGNTRAIQNPAITEHSRGQVYTLDETRLVATPVLNADLGVYSFALGSAQLLSNGDYHFLAGINFGSGGNFSQSIEVLPNGTLNFTEQLATSAYRSFRLPNFYTPPGT